MAEIRKIFDDIFDALTITSGTDYICLYDAVGKITRYSKAAVELFDLPGEYIPDGTSDWVKHVHPEDRKRYETLMENLLSGKTGNYNITYRVRMKGGDYGQFRFIGTVIRSKEDGQPEFVGGKIVNEGLLENTDSITVLRNQYGFLSDIGTIMETGQSRSILMIGISKMTELNEKYGYGFGNHLLQQLSWFIQENVGKYGTIYRMDGARFAFVTDEMDVKRIEEVYDRVRKQLADGIDVDGTRLNLTMNAGMLSTTSGIKSAQTYLSCLKQVYGVSKKERYGRLVDFEGKLSGLKNSDLKLIDTIRERIIDGCRGFSLHYMPAVREENELISGAEALLRFHDDELGDVAPLQYVPVLENDYIFGELGYWIIRKAMTDGVRFLNKNKDFCVAVNIAPAQIMDEFFVSELIDSSNEIGFPLDHVCIELTSSCRSMDYELLRSVVKRLKELKVMISLDDFGSGIASIDFLRDLQPDYIKFDMKYVRDIVNNHEDKQIIKHLAELAQACGTIVTIKGVENREIFDIVKEYNIQGYMGYYIGKPVPPEEYIKLI